VVTILIKLQSFLNQLKNSPAITIQVTTTTFPTLTTTTTFTTVTKTKKEFVFKNNHPIFAVLKNKEKNNKAIQWQIINHH
jgi:hypothetical protein